MFDTLVEGLNLQNKYLEMRSKMASVKKTSLPYELTKTSAQHIINNSSISNSMLNMCSRYLEICEMKINYQYDGEA